MSKIPKSKESPKAEKIIRDNPINNLVKNIYPSWQINKIDLEGTWGLNAISKFEFNLNNTIFDELVNLDLSDELHKALTSVNGRHFTSIDDFITKLCYSGSFVMKSEELKLVLTALTRNIFWSEIYPKLKLFEEKTWFEIEKEQFGDKSKTKHHFVNVGKIIQEARIRLKTLNLDNYDELFSIRLTGRIRIWGIREHGYMKILWFDLEHAICPT